MESWLTLEEAVAAPGLRIALVKGVASPWSELCRAIYVASGIPFRLVAAHDPKRGLSVLRPLTGQESLPVVFWNDERPRSNWLEQLHLAERLGGSRALLPTTPIERARATGLLAELCAERGFGWQRRILLIHHLLTAPAFGEAERRIGHYLGAKYGYAPEAVAPAAARCEAIVAAMAALASGGDGSLLGSELTALDLGWATFAALIQPLPDAVCPMEPLWRELWTWTPEETAPEAVRGLLARRDAIYEQCGLLPVPTR